MKHLVMILLAGLAAGRGAAQEPARHVLGYTVEAGDTVYQLTLREIVVYPQATFTSERAAREYRRLVYNFRKVYPYALQAKRRLHEMDSVVTTLATDAARRTYLKQQEKALLREFSAPLRKLTFTQGRLLMRLIDRELGQTSYYLIRDLRGRFAAFFWQGVARLFGADLKRPYDKYGEDRPVEAMIQMYHNGTFEQYFSSIYRP
jgi:hypothetical protein